MFKCHVCGGTAAREELVSEVFTVDERRVLVERIPAQMCERCGEATFSRTTKIKELKGPGSKIVRIQARPFAP